MDPLFDRLGRLFRSWNLEKDSDQYPHVSDDPDERAAEEELEAFLRNDPKPRHDSSQGQKSFRHEHPTKPITDPKTSAAYVTLGLSPGDSWQEIENAHKKLLRIHHPDRHASDPKGYQEATRTSQRINEAYQILKSHWGR